MNKSSGMDVSKLNELHSSFFREMQEILEDWNSWKYDIQDMNKSEWDTRDQSKLDMITAILEEQLQLQKVIKKND